MLLPGELAEMKNVTHLIKVRDQAFIWLKLLLFQKGDFTILFIKSLCPLSVPVALAMKCLPLNWMTSNM